MKFKTVDRESPVPLYYQIKEILRQSIVTGIYSVEDKLLSEHELCRKWQVSRITVSRALKDLENEGLIYRDQGKGTFVDKRKSGNIGLITFYSHLPPPDNFYAPIMEHIQSKIISRGFRLIHLMSPQSIIDFISKMDGFIIVGDIPVRHIQVLKSAGKPSVVLNGRMKDSFCVTPDDSEGARLAAQHLLNLGHRQILLFKAPCQYSSARIRLKSWQKTLASAGIALDENLVWPGAFDSNLGYEMMLDVLKKPPRFTAILAPNDLFAIGAMKALREKGIMIPKQVSIVGFDDIEMASHTSPLLTTIRIPCLEMTDIALEKLFEFIERRNLNHIEKVKLPCKLVVRESTASLTYS